MNRLNGMQICFLLSVLFSLVFSVASAVAQEPPSQPSSPAPADPQTSKPKDSPGDKDKDKTDATVGKSKLEKETGTVNDRIFEVLPNYGTVENADALPPLTSGQKFRLATASVFDWAAYPFNGALAAISQAKNNPKEWGQ